MRYFTKSARFVRLENRYVVKLRVNWGDCMQEKLRRKIRNKSFFDKIVSTEEAMSWIKDGMTLGISGFTVFGEPKAFIENLARHAHVNDMKVNLLTGASSAPYADKLMAELDVLYYRAPYQGNPSMRKKINDGTIRYTDLHLSHVGDEIRNGTFGQIDFAVIEATAITGDGLIIPSGSLGNSAVFVERANEVIIELNTALPEDLEAIHDVYVLEEFGQRREIPIYKPSDKIGRPGIAVDFSKVRGIIISNEENHASPLLEPNEETEQIANHLLTFFNEEVKAGRLPLSLRPLQ